MNIVNIAKQAGFENYMGTVGFLCCYYSDLHKFADLIIKQHEADNPVIITDNTQTIANMAARLCNQMNRESGY
jgi:hypothetical protein